MAGTEAARHGYRRGVILVLLATAGWSLSGVFVRQLPELDSWQINTWRGASMSLALLIYLVALYGSRTVERFQAIPLPAMLAAGGFFALGATFYVSALAFASTANVSCIAGTAPIFTALLTRAVTGEPAGRGNILAAFLAAIGVGVVFWDGIGAGTLAGTALAILVALSFAGQMVTLRRYRDFDMVPAVAIGGVAMFAVSGLAGGFDVPWESVGILAVMGIVQLGAPLILFVHGARTVPAVTLTLLVLLDVVLNPLWAWVGAGEQPALADALGGAIVISAVAVSVTRGRPRRQVAPAAGGLPPSSPA